MKPGINYCLVDMDTGIEGEMVEELDIAGTPRIVLFYPTSKTREEFKVFANLGFPECLSTTGLPGLITLDDYVTSEEETSLMASLEEEKWQDLAN